MAELSKIAPSRSEFNIIWISKDEGSNIFSPTTVAVGIELVHQNIRTAEVLNLASTYAATSVLQGIACTVFRVYQS